MTSQHEVWLLRHTTSNYNLPYFEACYYAIIIKYRATGIKYFYCMHFYLNYPLCKIHLKLKVSIIRKQLILHIMTQYLYFVLIIRLSHPFVFFYITTVCVFLLNFSYLFRKRHRFPKKIFEMNVSVFLDIFYPKISHCKKNSMWYYPTKFSSKCIASNIFV